MKTLARRLLLAIACLPSIIALSSCGDEEKLGSIRCKASKTFLIAASVPSEDWPSRHLYFEPSSHKGYSEPIYEASISSVLTNTGKEPFIVTALWAGVEEESVAPGASITLPPQPLKDYRISIAPSPKHDALIDFNFTLDRPITTDSSWNLIAAWSDGP